MTATGTAARNIHECTTHGGWEEYFDKFAYAVPMSMRAMTNSSYGFPEPVPTGPLKAFISAHEYAASHYYCAYPDSTTETVAAGLVLAHQVAGLRRDATRMEPDAFNASWDRFLLDAQAWL